MGLREMFERVDTRQQTRRLLKYLRADFRDVFLHPLVYTPARKSEGETFYPESYAADFTAVTRKDDIPVEGRIVFVPIANSISVEVSPREGDKPAAGKPGPSSGHTDIDFHFKL
jgi:hypothetical protein